MALVELSDADLSQALMLIAQVPTFDGTPEDLCSFITRIEGVLKLYPTQDERQTRILYLATDFRLSGEANRVTVMGEAKTWSELKAALMHAFTIRGFVDELEYKAFKIRSKLGLDDDEITSKDVIDKKLSDRYLKSLNQLDISTISILKKASQMRQFYETNSGLREKYKEPIDTYDSCSNWSQNDFCDLHKKPNSDISEESPEGTRLIRRAHRNLNGNILPL